MVVSAVSQASQIRLGRQSSVTLRDPRIANWLPVRRNPILARLVGPMLDSMVPTAQRSASSGSSQMATAEPIPAQSLLDALLGAGVTDVVAVPDTHQRNLISLIQSSDEIRFIQTTTEDEAVALSAGLIVGGRKPILQIQPRRPLRLSQQYPRRCARRRIPACFPDRLAGTRPSEGTERQLRIHGPPRAATAGLFEHSPPPARR